MIGFVLTLDYEIYGNGDGQLDTLAVKPTEIFLETCENFGAKGTIFVDVPEIISMKKYGEFKRQVDDAEEQLRLAHERGHDVQLHIHPWWFHSEYKNGKWNLNYGLTNLCDIPEKDSIKIIKECKNYLTTLMENTTKDYKCEAYRAGYWSMMPTTNIYDALVKSNIFIDTSVYKWGKFESDLLKYDYTEAYSNIRPWFIDRENVNWSYEPENKIDHCLEIPIYTEYKQGITFLTLKRFRLLKRVKSVMIEKGKQNNRIKKLKTAMKFIAKKRAKKFDFCKCSFYEMKAMIKNIVKEDNEESYLPVVAIGHSKDFEFYKDLERILDYINTQYSEIIEIVPLTVGARKYLLNNKKKVL